MVTQPNSMSEEMLNESIIFVCNKSHGTRTYQNRCIVAIFAAESAPGTYGSLSDPRTSQARVVGHLLYSGGTSDGSISYSGNYSQTPVSMNNRACCGTMSPVRRTFCLVLTFDMLLTIILWIMYTQIAGVGDIWHSVVSECAHYTFQSSLFDSVLCAAWRVIPLLLAYALFRINNPSVIAVTTFGTCAFLVVKVILFTANRNFMAYAVLVSSFLIAWIETWFLDFKVLPQEQFFREREAMGVYPDERSPLLQPDVTRDEYYSPVNSPLQSGQESPTGAEDHNRGHSRTHSFASVALSLGSEEKEYQEKAHHAWQMAWDILHDEDGWKRETGASLEGGIIYSKHFPKIGKLFKLEVCVGCHQQLAFESMVLGVTDDGWNPHINNTKAYIDADPQKTFEEMIVSAIEAPSWNATVLECKILQTIDDNTDICYTVAAEAAGGLVSSRDFVNLRHWKTQGDVILSAGCAVMHPDAPPTKKHVRGETRPGGWVFKPVQGEPDRCLFVWLCNTDLKGWIPQYVVDQAFSGTLLDFCKHLQNRMTKVKAKAHKNGRDR